jgi:hypothetical protein
VNVCVCVDKSKGNGGGVVGTGAFGGGSERVCAGLVVVVVLEDNARSIVGNSSCRGEEGSGIDVGSTTAGGGASTGGGEMGGGAGEAEGTDGGSGVVALEASPSEKLAWRRSSIGGRLLLTAASSLSAGGNADTVGKGNDGL